jgi:putative endonuclease
VDRLVWFEVHDEPLTAIAREKELKKWRRAWKIRLIEESNPEWTDLSGSRAEDGFRPAPRGAPE